jgi:dynein heavy chain
MYFICVITLTADEEECKVGLIAEEVSKKQKDCEEDLVKAEPALTAAQEALNTLNKVTRNVSR